MKPIEYVSHCIFSKGTSFYHLQRKNAEIPDKIDEELEEEGGQVLGDILENTYYFEQANVGIGREESFRVFLALKQLSDAYPFESCRFWGE